MIRTIIVDDHFLCRLGIRHMLSETGGLIEVVAEAADADGFFKIYEDTPADLVILDIILPGQSGVDIVRRLKTENSSLKILMLSSESSPEVIGELVELGVDGFVSKNVDSAELRLAVEQVAAGIQYFGADIAKIIHYISEARADSCSDLSDREREIIAQCAKGLTVKEIAWNLNIGIGTVNTHKNNIFKKLGINNSVELVMYALKHGIISL